MEISDSLIAILFVTNGWGITDRYPKSLALQWAYNLIESGIDSYYVCQVAGAINDTIDMEILEKALKELNIELPSKKAAENKLLLLILEDYFSGLYSSRELCGILAEKVDCDDDSTSIFYPFYLGVICWEFLDRGIAYEFWDITFDNEEQLKKFLDVEYLNLMNYLKSNLANILKSE